MKKTAGRDSEATPSCSNRLTEKGAISGKLKIETFVSADKT